MRPLRFLSIATITASVTATAALPGQDVPAHALSGVTPIHTAPDDPAGGPGDPAVGPLVAQLDGRFLSEASLDSVGEMRDRAGDGVHWGPRSHEALARRLPDLRAADVAE